MIYDTVTNQNHGLLESKAAPSSQRLPGERHNGSGLDIIGRSRTLDRVLEQVQTVAATDSTVLILGETGSGKELIARAIHNLSSRRHRAHLLALSPGLLGALSLRTEEHYFLTKPATFP
jgi:formate hydrogenlyase transcriptional activator